MKYFGGPYRGQNIWGKKTRKRRSGIFVFLKNSISFGPPSWNKIGRPSLIVLTALMMTVAGLLPSIGEHVRIASAATITVCASGCDTTTIIAAINSSSDGDTISLSGESYNVTSSLDIAGKAKIFTGAGAGSTTVNLSTSGAAFSPSTSQDAGSTYTISGIRFEKTSSTPGILNLSNQANSLNLNFLNNYVNFGGFSDADAIYVASTTQSAITATITGNTFQPTFGMWQAIDWDANNTGSASSLVLNSNTFVKGSELIDVASTAKLGAVTVDGNTIANYSSRAMRIQSGTSIAVENNIIGSATTTGNGITLTPLQGASVNVLRNTITLADGFTNKGISVTDTDEAQINIYRNKITGSDVGINVSNQGTDVGNTSIYDNVLHDLTTTGIDLSGGTGDAVYNIINNTVDTISGGSKNGILMTNADSNARYNVMYNSVTNVAGTGISCDGSNGTFKVSYNNTNGSTTDYSNCSSVGSDGNIDVVPHYNDQNGSDYSLATTSTCSGAADNCDSGHTSSTILHAEVIDSGSTYVRTAIDLQGDDYNGMTVTVLSGTGSGQSKSITNVVGISDQIQVSSWDTTPSTDSVIAVQLVHAVDYVSSTRVMNTNYDIGAYEVQQNSAPGVPTTLRTAMTSTAAGFTNPTNLTTTTPVFSALTVDSNSGDNLVYARIQVSTSSDFSAISHWDSQKTAIATTTEGSRNADITYGNFGGSATTSLALNDGAITYYWRIKFWDDDDAEGSYSTESATFTLNDNLSAPTNATTTYGSDNLLAFQWSDNSSNETGFKVYRSVSGNETTLISTTAANAFSYLDTTAAQNFYYVYSVIATDGADDSASSTAGAVYTSSPAPSSITSTVNGTGSITWTWTNGASFYDSVRLDSETGELVDIDNISGAQVTTTQRYQLDIFDELEVTTLAPSSRYGIHLHAVNPQRGESASSTASYTWTDAAVPGSLAAGGDTNDSSITVSWTQGSNPMTSTDFYVENTTAGTNSGWLSSGANSYKFTDLVLGTNYTFRVKARNPLGVETSYSAEVTTNTESASVSVTDLEDSGNNNGFGGSSGAGGDGGGFGGDGGVDGPMGMIMSCGPGCIVFVPSLDGIDSEGLDFDDEDLTEEEQKERERVLGAFFINRGARKTASPDVTLFFRQKGVTHFAISDEPSLSGAPLVPYVEEMSHTFPDGDGEKILYAQFFNMERGTRSVISQARITLDTTVAQKAKLSAPIVKDAPTFESMDDWLVAGAALSGTAAPNSTVIVTVERNGLRDEMREQVGRMRAQRGDERRRRVQGLDRNFGGEDGFPGAQNGEDFSEGFDEDDFPDFDDFQGDIDFDNFEFGDDFGDGSFLEDLPFIPPGLRDLDNFQGDVDFEGENNMPDGMPGVGDGGNFPAPPGGGFEGGGDMPAFPAGGFQEGNGAFPPFSENIDPLKTIRIAASSKTTHTTDADAEGNWSISFEQSRFAQEGEYVFAVVVEDADGDQSNPSEFTAINVTTEADVEVPEVQPEPVVEEEVVVVPPEDAGVAEEGGQEGDGDDGDGDGGSIGGGGTVSVEPPKQQEEKAVTVAISETVTEAVEQAIEAVKQVQEVSKVVAQETVKEVVKGVKETVIVAKIVADNPVVEEVNETVAAPTVAVAAAANVATGANIPTFLLYLRFLFLQPAMLFGRKKRKAWGIVYNGFTKMPVDLALVRLVVAETKQVIQSKVTDTAGRYSFLAKPGTYVLEVQKPGYGKISEHLAKIEEDGEFKPIYHGQTIPIKDSGSPVSPFVPVDPDVKKGEAKKLLKRNWWKRIQAGLSLAGVFFAVVSFVISPTPLVGGLAVFQVVAFFAFRRLAKRGRKSNDYGTIKDKKTGKPLAKAIVRIFDKEYNKLLETRVTDNDGRYLFLVGQNTYYVIVEAEGYTQYISKPFEMKEPGAVTTDVKLVEGFARAKAPTAELAAAAEGPGTGGQKEREVEKGDRGKTRISADGVPQPSAGFLRKMGVSVSSLARTSLGAELPLAMAGAGPTSGMATMPVKSEVKNDTKKANKTHNSSPPTSPVSESAKSPDGPSGAASFAVAPSVDPQEPEVKAVTPSPDLSVPKPDTGDVVGEDSSGDPPEIKT